MTFHVLIPDSVHPSALQVLQAAGTQLRVTAPGQMTRAETSTALADADALIIRSATKVDAELLSNTHQLKAIARAGVGVDNVDVKTASAMGIVVMNTPEGNTIATAEQTFALMLALARHIPQAHISMREGKWDRKSYMGVELRNKTLGIVGFGRIGRAVAKRAQAFEMHVIAYDPYVSAASAAEIGVEMVSLDDIYRRSDFISLHTVLNDETRQMIRAENIAKMKNGVRIINAARGALIHETELADAIRSGRVAGAALDVYAQEPPSPDHPLVGQPNVIHTPHLAASTEEAQVAVAVEAAHLIMNGLLKGEWRNVVNPDVLKK